MDPERSTTWEQCDEPGCIGRRLDEQRVCLAHADADHRRAALEAFRLGGDLDASGVVFSDELLLAVLDAAPSIAGTDGMRGPELRRVRFREATFGDGAGFLGATFGGGADAADFHGATFGDGAEFVLATFGDRADFNGATFGDGAEFAGTTFGADAFFSEATFGDCAEFNTTTFGDGADFNGAKFGDRAVFGPLFVSGNLKLGGARFAGAPRLQIAAKDVDCEVLDLPDGAISFKLRWASVDLSGARIRQPTTVSPLRSRVELAIRLEVLPSWAKEGEGSARPSVVSLCDAEVGQLTLTDVKLDACRFAGAQQLDQLRLEGDTTFAPPPRGWRQEWLGWPHRWRFWRWTPRDTLAEEHQWRAHTGSPGKQKGWDPHEGEPLDARRVAVLYRSLRKAREDLKDEPGAADFYYGERGCAAMRLRLPAPSASC